MGLNGVHINISTRHGHLGTESRDAIASKLERLGRFHERIASVDVTVDLVDPQTPDVEVIVAVEGAPRFLASARGTNLLGAVESASQKLEEQLRRHKEKLIGAHRALHKRDQWGVNEAEGESLGNSELE